MPAFLADENFNGAILRGLLRRRATLQIKRLQDAGLSGADDPAVLDYAAQEKRVLLTHDAATIPEFAYARIAAGMEMPGVLVVKRSLAIRQAIDEILLVAVLSLEGEWTDQIRYLPL